MAKDEEPEFSAQLIGNISDAELDRLIAELGKHPVAEGELREVKECLCLFEPIAAVLAALSRQCLSVLYEYDTNVSTPQLQESH
jgi:hypothetical protein